jgi:hypothetical protein
MKGVYSSMKKHLVTWLVGGAILGQASASFAVQFANFGQQLSTNGFYYTGVKPAGTSTLTNGPGGSSVPVNFFFQDLLGGDLPGVTATTNVDYVGLLTINASATAGENPVHSFQNKLDALKLTITAANNATNVAAGLYNPITQTGKILLMVTAGQATNPANPKTFGGLLTAQDATGSAGIQGGNPPGESDNFADFVNFTSQAINVNGLTHQAYGLTFTEVSGGGPNYTKYQPGPFGLRYLDTFNANGVGTFSAQPSVPEPGTLALAVGSLISFSVVGLRRRRK